MALSYPTFPTERVFVDQMHAEANIEQGRFWGHVEHIVSGQVAHVSSMAELVTFIMQVLSSATEASEPSGESHDP
jgi:hypothetical protein